MEKNNNYYEEMSTYMRKYVTVGACIIMIIGLIVFMITVKDFGPHDKLPVRYMIIPFTTIVLGLGSMIWPLPKLASRSWKKKYK